jgi:ribonuclease P protein component
VLRGREQRAGRLAVVYVRAADHDGPARIAVVASRKVGIAVARNRAKRLLREAARHLEWTPGIDVVLVARRACASSVFAEVHTELACLSTELSVLEPLQDVS